MTRLLAPFAGGEAAVIARRLLARFGNLAALFHATPADVSLAAGKRPDIACKVGLLGELVRETLVSRTRGLSLFPTPEAVLDYLGFDMAERRVETLRVLFLDSAHRLLSDEIVAEGSIASLHFSPREIIRRALAVDATAMIMVHNHPCAPAIPSEEDVRATQETAALSKQLDIALLDHLIVARCGWRSMRADGHV